MSFFSRSRLAGALALMLLVSACGSDSNVPANEAAVAANAAAEANLGDLDQGNNVLEAEILDVSDGSISSLGQAIDGDRPVLLWFYSPH